MYFKFSFENMFLSLTLLLYALKHIPDIVFACGKRSGYKRELFNICLFLNTYILDIYRIFNKGANQAFNLSVIEK